MTLFPVAEQLGSGDDESLVTQNIHHDSVISILHLHDSSSMRQNFCGVIGVTRGRNLIRARSLHELCMHGQTACSLGG